MFTIHKISPSTPIPEPVFVSSVALIAMNSDGQILATRHKSRGWDIPGGHVEMNESVETALAREVHEEAGATFLNAILVATITSDTTDEKYHGKSMLIFATHDFTVIDAWTPASDVSDRRVIPVEEMLAGYSGDKDGMRSLITIARERLKEKL
jgi:ADP-ribose pyrophosphatase YjhB (NUDIX family)